SLWTVVECGTMGKADERLAIAQPVVSKAIADMEHALEVRLLDRSQRGVEPTPYGWALIKRGIAIFDEMRQGIEEIEFLSDPTAGEVRIGATDPINAAIVAPVIDRLSRQYPRMTFHVVAGVPGPLRQEVAARNVDFAISRFAQRSNSPLALFSPPKSGGIAHYSQPGLTYCRFHSSAVIGLSLMAYCARTWT